MGKILSNDRVRINDVVIAYKANTLIDTKGYSTGSIVVSTRGGGDVKKDVSKDDSTAIAKVAFELSNTEDNIRIAEEWKNLFDEDIGSVIEIGERGVYQNMYFVGEFSIDRKHEGSIKIEFQG
jgi:hypothetical protein